jgi:Holliday junction resolvasome RuvABC DNA-binding subunit
VLELLDINGIGPKTAQILYKQFNISSMAQFREFVAGGGLEMVGGIGEKTAKRIVESLKHDITD